MALTLRQISELDTARKTGQPQDMAAMMAMLMAGGGLNNLTDGGNGGSPDTGTLTAGDDQSQFIQRLLNSLRGPQTGQGGATAATVSGLEGTTGGGDVPGPVSEPGPGPITLQDVQAQIAAGKDPAQAIADALAQNQSEMNVANTGARVASFVNNPVTAVAREGAGLLGAPPGVGKAAGTAAGTLQTLGLVPGPPNPAAIPALVTKLALDLLAKQDVKQNVNIATKGIEQFRTVQEPNLALRSGGVDDPGGGLPGVTVGSAPQATAQDISVGLAPSAPAAPEAPAPDVSISTPGMGTAIASEEGESPQGIQGIDLSLDAPATGTTSEGLSADPGSVGLSDAGDIGDIGDPGISVGEGGSGDGGGGAGGSLLANFATGDHPPPQFRTFYDQFMKAHPKDGKKLFTAYQTVAKQVIARAKSRKEEEQLQDKVYDEFIDPVMRYMDDGDVDLATDTLVRTTRNLARKYGVPIPDRYESVLKRQ